MFKLWATIQKDVRLLGRDKVGLTLMFLMPIVLAILITAIQNSTFKLVNDNKVTLMICNKDKGEIGKHFVQSMQAAGMFYVLFQDSIAEKDIVVSMEKNNALVALVIPSDFSSKIETKAAAIGGKIFLDLGLSVDSSQKSIPSVTPLQIYYQPVLQESYRQSIGGAVRGALQLLESKQLIKNLYASVNEKKSPEGLEQELEKNQTAVTEIIAARNGSRDVPNATQHNIPAWTIFAMFFVVISLGSSVVKEKLNGSFVRLKTLPSNYFVSLLSKQITYLVVTQAQVMVIFAIGIYLFPLMGLPKLNLPEDYGALALVSLICGWCAVSYAICIGTFAQTQEQANGFGAVTIVILAAIGGLLVPSFAMPEAFKIPMKLSPLHWCLESYYGLFLEGGKLRDIILNILPLLLITASFQLISFWGLKRKKLI